MSIDVDALIVGGGSTGLWLRAVLQAYGRTVVLIEADALGAGQTIASQGILHMGAKYAADASNVGELLHVLGPIAFAWNQHLSGENIPDLRGVEMTTSGIWYWNPEGPLPACFDEWWNKWKPNDPGCEAPPEFMTAFPDRARFNSSERALSSPSLLEVLAGEDRHDLLHVPTHHVRWNISGPGQVDSVTLAHPAHRQELSLRPKHVFFTAGAGNAALREAVGLPGETLMQRRPLRMGLVRGDLPRFCGHWFDDRGPRLTISTQFSSEGGTIWQLGGRLAEEPAETSIEQFLASARREVVAGLPGIDLTQAEWSAYSAIRAEPATFAGRIPSLPEILHEGNTITMWPTKLTLVPYLMIDVRRALDAGGDRPLHNVDLPDWPPPDAARPPWETAADWMADADISKVP